MYVAVVVRVWRTSCHLVVSGLGRTPYIDSSYKLALIEVAEDEGDRVDTTVGWARCPEVIMGCSTYFHESAAYAHAMRDASAAEV
jgi:hypothetical protein